MTKLNQDSDDELAIFRIKSINNHESKEALKNIITNRTILSSYVIDDFLLQHLEDLGFIYKKKIVYIHNIDQLFGYYIVAIFENVEIKKYIEWARKNDNDIYSNFERLYHKLKLNQNNSR